MEIVRNRILVIPDVHGRDFWRMAVRRTYCEKIVFLGDYFDPYESEGIDIGDTCEIFCEVLDLKKENPEKVVLLLGNHDMHYLSNQFRKLACGSRYDNDFAQMNACMLIGHKKYFQLAHEEMVGGKRYLFTHAGVTSSWYERHQGLIKELTATNLNELMETKEGVEALADVGKLRGGYQPSGSMVWADCEEMHDSVPFPDVYQIFGHSQQKSEPIITEHYACLDCRKAFLLDEKGLKTM